METPGAVWYDCITEAGELQTKNGEEKMKRILIFGDSILKGVYYSEEEGRHRLYRERQEEMRAAGFDVKNCSVMGATVTTGEALLHRKLAESLTDDSAVILEYGGNDCDYRWKEISDDPGGDFLPNTPEDSFIRRYEACIEYVRRAGARVFLCNLVPLEPEKYMNWISRDLCRENILSWLGDVGHLYRWQTRYSEAAERVARRTGCALIDLRKPFFETGRYGDFISKDGIHPTVEGHRMIDRALLAAVGG